MKFPRRLPHFRSLKFAPFAVIALFLFTNLTGILFSHVLAPVVVASPLNQFTIPADIPTSGDEQLDRIIFEVGEKQGVDPRFIHAVIWQESKYDPHARSHAGAQGLMQLMPATAKRFGCDNPDDPVENVTAGTKYLGWLLKRFSGNVELALAGYNAGEGSVDKYSGVPPYQETRNYVKIISQRYGKLYHPVPATNQAAD
ncbi:MAG TPA: lytic transglycosylase domain-containing protein [Pyrinomonadaceae bacterium]|nr:lytic transglycosylase domain-containing protein [Pyrinomonadaceae bacterium]